MAEDDEKRAPDVDVPVASTEVGPLEKKLATLWLFG